MLALALREVRLLRVAKSSQHGSMYPGGAYATSNHCLAALVFLLALPSVALLQEASISGLDLADPYKISVSVSSVVLHATVENHKGVAVSGLGKDDFQVYEDGALQQIEYL